MQAMKQTLQDWGIQILLLIFVIAEIVAVSDFDKISMQEGYTQKPAVLTHLTQNTASSTPAPQEKGDS